MIRYLRQVFLSRRFGGLDAMCSNDSLITVLIISYCSTEGIFPTLMSVFEQNHSFVEVVIADDGTPGFDKDVPAIQEFVRLNARENIKDVRVLESCENRGTVANINRGIEDAQGAYIKILPADDTLRGSGTLSEYLSFMREHPDVDIVFSKIHAIALDGANYDFARMPEKDIRRFDTLSNAQIANMLYRKNIFSAPTWFAKKDLFERYGLFPTCVRLVEDYPYWCMLARTDCRFGFIDKALVNYKLSGVTSKKRPNKTVIEDLIIADREFVFPYDKRYGIFQPMCNAFKRGLSNFSLELARWDDMDAKARVLSILRHAPYHVLNAANNAVKARRGK